MNQTRIHVKRIRSDDDVVINDFSYLLHLQNNNDSVDEAKQGLLKSIQMFNFLAHDNTQSYFFIAYQEDDRSKIPAGYIAVQRIPKADHRGGFLFVDELFVNPECRRQGVGTILLEHVKQVCASSPDVVGVRLLCRLENENAKNLYVKSAFNMSTTYFGQNYPEKSEICSSNVNN